MGLRWDLSASSTTNRGNWTRTRCSTLSRSRHLPLTRSDCVPRNADCAGPSKLSTAINAGGPSADNAASFWGGERKFLEPPMRFMRDDVRDHIVFIQNRSRTSVVALKSDAAAEKSKDQLSRDFPGRSTFATISALNGHGAMSAMSPLRAQKRTLTKPPHDGAGQHALLRISVPSATAS